MEAAFVSEPWRIAWTNSGGSAVAAKAVVVIGSIIGIALDAVTTGATGVLEIGRIWSLPKHAGETWVQGDELYWDATNRYLTLTSTGNTRAGRATANAASAASTANINLNAA